MTKSIRTRLLLLLTSSLFLVCLLIVALTWWHTQIEVHRLFDSQMVQMARLLAVTTEHEHEEQDLQEFALDLQRQGYEYPVLFQVWSGDGRLLVRGPEAPGFALSGATQDGYSGSRFENQSWRVYTLITRESGHRIQVAHDYSVRDALIREFMLNILRPLLLTLLLPVVLWFGVTRGLAPLRWVATQLSGSDPGRLRPLTNAQVPVEILPLVNAIHNLLVRLQDALDRYRRFTADAAHELRTPVAGAIIQAHAALGETSESEREQSLKQVLASLKRLGHLLDQLLVLARAEPEGAARFTTSIGLKSIATEVISDLGPSAFDKGVDIELFAEREVRIKGNDELIGVLLRNLLENAIRATPSGGTLCVVLALSPEGPCLSVEDSGPGIPDAEKSRVLERFRRLPGTPGRGAGLGLSIVQAVAEIHGARIFLKDRNPPPGLRVLVCFPAADAVPVGISRNA